MYEVDIPVYFEVLRREGYETRTTDRHVATFLKYKDAKVIAGEQKDYSQKVGSVKPTFYKGEGFTSIEAYREHQERGREARRQRKLEEVNTERRKFGWKEFSTFEEMDKTLYKGELKKLYGYERRK